MTGLNAAVISTFSGANAPKLVGVNPIQYILQASVKSFVNPTQTIEINGEENLLSSVLNETIAIGQTDLFTSLSSGTSAYSLTDNLVSSGLNRQVPKIVEDI